tara:strand:+ start:4545 stop:5513 length:969 start_codon:yes stop_codon:yes gene_type:complete
MDKTAKRLDAINDILSNRTQLSKDGVNLNIWCPFCNNPNKNKMKLSIHLEKSFYHCWVCDKKGSNIHHLFSKLSKNIPEKYFSLFKRYEKKYDLFELSNLEEDLEPVILPNDFKFIVEDFSTIYPNCKEVIRYAIKRGFNKHKMHILRPGFSNSSDFERYLILPSYDANGDLNYYTSRKIDANTHDAFKYKNASIPKSKIIFNEINIDWNIPLTLVEGPLDLIKCNDNSTCLLGSSLTEDMLLFQKIAHNKTPVKLALDSDIYNKTLKIASLLHSYDISVDIIDTRGFEDVAEMTHNAFSGLYDNSQKYNENDRLLNKIRLL